MQFFTFKSNKQKFNNEEEHFSEFSFNITNDYPNKIIENKGFILIGKSSNMLYSIDAMRINKNDIGVIEKVKNKTILTLIEMDINKYSKENIEKASNIAIGFLADKNVHENKNLLAYLIAHDTIGYGPIGIILDNAEGIEEIVVNSPSSNIMVFHQKYGYCKTNLAFNGERQFKFIINKLIESIDRELNLEFPVLDANIFNGSRIHAQLSPYATTGAVASIRLNQDQKFNLKKLFATKSVSEDIIAYIWMAIECDLNIIISGAPASGKSSLLMSIVSLMPRYHRIISIEENINEVMLSSNFINSVSLQGMTSKGKIDTKAQVINSLRLRPDRIIIGEIRGSETEELFSGANLGIPFITTMHSSENGIMLINKLISKPMNVQQGAISMLDISILMRQNMSSRKLHSISEYKWLMRGEITIKDILDKTNLDAAFNELPIVEESALNFKELKHSKVIEKYSKKNLISIAESIAELKKRTEFLSKINNPEDADALKGIEDFIALYNNIKD